MRTVPPTLAPTATYLLQVTLPLLVFDTNAVFAITGDIMIDSVPTTPVEFAIPLGMLLMIVQLNIFPPCSRPRSLEVPSSVITRGLVIEPGAQMYEGGNVMILFPYCSILLIIHSFCLLTWRGRGNVRFLNTAYILVCSISTFSLVTLPSDTLIS